MYAPPLWILGVNAELAEDDEDDNKENPCAPPTEIPVDPDREVG